ncbi:MAG TPA: BamA/TamA family outer membrane protein, partial [Candidatus Limnocylindria bacterium]|nr:BamA/TamA family outer membrane protein [Candidatus Limnocylindria bacterium]
MTRLCKIVIATLIGFFVLARSAEAVPVDALDPNRQWRVERIELSGNRVFSDDELKGVIVTKERPWYRFWNERPAFDPVTFGTDLERLQRFYEARGYYDTTVAYDLDIDENRGLVAARVEIREGLPPVLITAIDVEVSADPQVQTPPPLPEQLPVKRGEIFNESEYQQAEQVLRGSFLRSGHAHVKSERRAEVDLDERSARLRYSIEPGPVAAFGQTIVKGTDTVAPELVSRELTYKAGEIYSLDKIVESRDKILALDLFSLVRIAPAQTAGAPAVVPMEIEVSEKSHREIKIGLGYSTEDEFRTQLEWRHLNWLGGGRRLSVVGKYSSITLSGAVNFVQPHFLSPRTQGLASFSHDLEKEETYNRNVTRFSPRLDHRFSSILTGFIGYRVEYDSLSDIAPATVQGVGEIQSKGILSGPSVGLVWNTSDDPFNPKKGEVISLVLEQAGSIWGGAFNFYKFTAEAKKYIEIGWQTVFASRLKLGLGDAIGSDKNYPLFERYYAGGEKSVRGYGRRRLGPLSA